MNGWIYKQRSHQHLGKLNDFMKTWDFIWSVATKPHNILSNFGKKNQFLCRTWMCPLLLTVVLPPEKAEGCESYLQYLHSEDGEREILRDANKAPGKKRISLDVRRFMIWQICNSLLWLSLQLHYDSKAYYMSCVHRNRTYSKKIKNFIFSSNFFLNRFCIFS